MGVNNDSGSPQANAATNITDPSSADSTFTFAYNNAANLKITSYKTFIQDQANQTAPAAFASPAYIPSSSPFILSLTGTGFNSGIANNSLLVYLVLDGNIAVIPQLPDSANYKTGKLFGYKVISDTQLFVYFNTLLPAKIWISDLNSIAKFNGKQSTNLKALETGTGEYAYLNSAIPNATIYVAVNNSVQLQDGILSKITAQLILPITQSPYIVGAIGCRNKQDGTLSPTITANEVSVSVYGHGLTETLQPMLVADASILSGSTSVIPKNILTADHSKSVLQNTPPAQVANLTFFKDGANSAFLGKLKDVPAELIIDYKYFDENFAIQSNFNLSSQAVKGESFDILSMPNGNYSIVIYDTVIGVYSVAAEKLTINNTLQATAIQIHDVSPAKVVLQAPTLTINGFNLPTAQDLQNGATLAIGLFLTPDLKTDGTSYATKTIYNDNNSKLNREGYLLFNNANQKEDAGGKGNITFISTTQIKVNFSSLNVSPDIVSSYNGATLTLVLELSTNTNASFSYSPTILPVIPPKIYFLTNSIDDDDLEENESVLLGNNISVDGDSGQTILNGTSADSLFIVGANFTNGTNKVITAGNDILKIKNFISSKNTTFGEASIFEVQFPGNENSKKVVPISVSIDSIPSDPALFLYTLDLNNSDVIQLGNGNVKTKETITKNAVGLFAGIPTNDINKKFYNSNVMVSSSLNVSLTNSYNGIRTDVSTNKVNIQYSPDQIVIPAGTNLTGLTTVINFNVYDVFTVSYSTPSILQLIHKVNKDSKQFAPGETALVVGSGFVNGTRYKIGDGKWQVANSIAPIGKELATTYNVPSSDQFFEITLPKDGSGSSKVEVSNQDAQKVSSVSAAGFYKQGAPNVSSITINAKYSDMLAPKQKLPLSLNISPKGTQATLTDFIDSMMSIYGQLTPFLNSFRMLLVPIRVIVCIIDVICALINPFQLVVAIIALMDCIIDLLSLFPQLAIPIMILSFLQNFLPFIQTLIVQMRGYVLSLVNTLLAQVRAAVAKDTAFIAAAEQQAFAELRQVFDAIAFLQPPLSIILIFQQLLQTAMKFPCASNLGGGSGSKNCPPDTIKNLIAQSNDETETKKPIPTVNSISFIRKDNVVSVGTDNTFPVQVGDSVLIEPGDVPNGLVQGVKVVASVIDYTHFTYSEQGTDTISIVVQTISDPNANDPKRQALSQAYCQAIDLQIATLSTMPGITGLGDTSNSPIVNITLPDVSNTIECMTLLANNIQDSLNADINPIMTIDQANAQVAAFIACLETLSAQTQQTIDDVCPLAISGINSDLTVSPRKGLSRPKDNFVKIKATTDDSSEGSQIDLVPFSSATTIDDSSIANVNLISELGVPQDFESPILFTTTNQSGLVFTQDNLSFDTASDTLPGLVNVGDIIQFVGGDYNGLQYVILSLTINFSVIKIKTKLNITPEQQNIIKCGVPNSIIPIGTSGFDIRVISSLGVGNIAIVDADGKSTAEIQIYPVDHHGHLLGSGFANKIALTLVSGSAIFDTIIPSAATDDLGIIQESGDHYIAKLKADCPGVVIISAAVCGTAFVDVGYDTTDPTSKITTRIKTIQVIFKPTVSSYAAGTANTRRPLARGTHVPN